MKTKKKILIIAAVFPPEPVVSASIHYDLACELSKKHEVTILRPVPTRPMGFDNSKDLNKDLPFNVITINSYTYPKSLLIGRFIESISMGKHCARYIKNNYEGIDFIYNAPWQLFGRYMVAKAAKKYNIPYITPVQDIYPEFLLFKMPKWKFLQKIVNSILLPLDKITLSYASKIHTISNKMKEYLAVTRNINKDKFVVISNWQDEMKFLDYHDKNKSEQLCKNDLFTFMYLGNIAPTAGVEILIDAFIQSNMKKCRLVIAGSGSSKEKLIKRASQDLSVNIEFWEAQADDVPLIQAKADVMMLPIKKGVSSTSIPSKLPAYMFSAKPVIACVDENSDTALSISTPNAGWISVPEDVEMLVSTMKIAANTPKSKLTAMGKNGFDFALKNFSRKFNLKKLTEACEEVMR